MIADHMTHEGTPIGFHDNSFPDIYSNFVLIAVELFESESLSNRSSLQTFKELLENMKGFFLIFAGKFLELFLKMF